MRYGAQAGIGGYHLYLWNGVSYGQVQWSGSVEAARSDALRLLWASPVGELGDGHIHILDAAGRFLETISPVQAAAE